MSQPALRVSQLDASALDFEVTNIIKEYLIDSVKYVNTSILSRFDSEIELGLQFILWRNTVEKCGSTVGQKLLDMKYQSLDSQRRNYFILSYVIPYLGQKFSKLSNVWEVAKLINFIVFLAQGKYLTITERFLGINSVFLSPQRLKDIASFEFMDREMLWHAFSELLFFILPLINTSSVKSRLLRFISSSKDSEGKCVYCNDLPFNVQQLSCKHIACYYCSKTSNSICPIC